MSTIKKSDVKNHLSPGFRTKIHLCPPVSQPDSSSTATVAPAKPVAGSTSPQPLAAVSKSARA